MNRITLFFVLFSVQLLGTFPSKPGEDTWVNKPNDPSYPSQWQFFSHLPPNHTGQISKNEAPLGSGMHLDKAWQFHIGTPDTVIAVLDSGIFWNEPDLVHKLVLNPKELPLPFGSSTYDTNKDGRISVQDYLEDPRVKDINQNGSIDPEDLIVIFSNQIDEDGNGYLDDICGWDFHENDNNPYDRIRFGHGTAEALDSAAEIHNGIGTAGACGKCSILPLRVDDSFIVDSNAFSAAVRYATEQGVDLIQQALGSFNFNEFTKQSVELAYKAEIPIIGSAADENSYHHNFPSTLDPIVYANAIRHDTNDPKLATTFLNFNNCSNYGARVDVSVSARFCSSEATGLLSGMTALGISFAKSLHGNLSAGEWIALIKSTATDINLGTNESDPFRHSTFENWDTITGYGRANAYHLLKAIEDKQIPAEVRILTPHWFAPIESTSNPTVSVSVQTSSREKYSLSLELFRGVETENRKGHLLREIPDISGSWNGEMVTFTKSEMALAKLGKHDADRNKYAYTLRLTATTHSGIKSESRKTFFYFSDPYLQRSFPKKLAGSGESAGFFLDLDGDGSQEYITADGAGLVHAYSSKGIELPGFPVMGSLSRHSPPGKNSVFASIVAPIAAGDINGDGNHEIVSLSTEGHLAVINKSGALLPGFPVQLPYTDLEQASKSQWIANGFLASPTLVDLNNDGKDDIVIAGMDGYLHAYSEQAKSLPHFPVPIMLENRRAKIVSSPATTDVNRDGIPDLIVGSNHTHENFGYLFAIDGRGQAAKNLIVPPFPVKIPILRKSILPTIGTGIPTTPAVGDIDRDGEKEIVIHGFLGKSYVVSLDGKLIKSLSMRVSSQHETNDQFMISGLGHPALADLTAENGLHPITTGVGQRVLVNLALGGKKYDVDHMIGAWDGVGGQMLPSFPRRIDDTLLSPSPISVDLNGDSKEEIIVGSGGYFMHAYSDQGEAKGFPHFSGGWHYATASAGDFDGDGKTDIAATTREGYLFIWKTEGNWDSGSRGWITFKGNVKRTGVRQ